MGAWGGRGGRRRRLLIDILGRILRLRRQGFLKRGIGGFMGRSREVLMKRVGWVDQRRVWNRVGTGFPLRS